MVNHYNPNEIHPTFNADSDPKFVIQSVVLELRHAEIQMLCQSNAFVLCISHKNPKRLLIVNEVKKQGHITVYLMFNSGTKNTTHILY